MKYSLLDSSHQDASNGDGFMSLKSTNGKLLTFYILENI